MRPPDEGIRSDFQRRGREPSIQRSGASIRPAVIATGSAITRMPLSIQPREVGPTGAAAGVGRGAAGAGAGTFQVDGAAARGAGSAGMVTAAGAVTGAGTGGSTDR